MLSCCEEDDRTNGRLEAQVSENGLAVNQFLCDESSSGKHCQTTILELLCANDAEFFRVGGLEAQRIEAKISLLIECHEAFKIMIVGSMRQLNVVYLLTGV
jgi:hypothetical protein